MQYLRINNMNSTSILFFDCLLLCLLLCFDVAQPIVDCGNNNTIYNTNSTTGRIYRSNLGFLLSTLTSNASRPNGFYNFTVVSVGSSDDTTVYGLFLCRGDAKPDACQDCVATASNETLRTCPDRNIATAWYDICMLRYSNRSIFSIMDTSPNRCFCNSQNVTDTALLNRVLGDEMDQIAINAANNDIAGKKFAVKDANFSAFQRRLYALGQCTPDLSSLDCGACLRTAIGDLPRCCNNRQGARVLMPSCNIRYEIYPFYDISTPPPPPPEPVPNLPLPPPPLPSPARSKGNPKYFSKVRSLYTPLASILHFVGCVAVRTNLSTGSSEFGFGKITFELNSNHLSNFKYL